MKAFQSCADCTEYAGRRIGVLANYIPVYARKHGVSPRRMFHLYFSRVHDRHLTGLSIGAPPP